MANAKRRPFQHITEDESIVLVKSELPLQWVVRQCKPDYRIGLVVETFDVVDEAKELCEMLGEHFCIQLKSVRSTVFHEITVAPRRNVELYPIGAERSAQVQDQPWLKQREICHQMNS